MRYIICELAFLGLSHGDLVPRNILVHDSGYITGIIDWDNCTPLHTGGEYAKRVIQVLDDPDDLIPGE